VGGEGASDGERDSLGEVMGWREWTRGIRV